MVDSARRVPQLDGIRGTAILLVIIWHFIVVPLKQGPHNSAISRIIAHVGVLTWSGVDLFFVLSYGLAAYLHLTLPKDTNVAVASCVTACNPLPLQFSRSGVIICNDSNKVELVFKPRFGV